MKIPLSWLAEYVDLPPTDRLVERLNETGTSIEAIETFGEGLDKIIVGQIQDVIPHPNADKLRVAKVKVPSGILNIVCGAPNIAPNQKAPVALVGTSVPRGPDGAPLKIEKRKIREVESEGMLCSARELGLGESHDGILILDPETRTGDSLGKLLDLPDTIIDTEITPNRGDKLSIYGTAREVSAITATHLKRLSAPEVALEGKGTPLTAQITDPRLARRYAAVTISGIKIAPSPAFIQARLSASGIRPINNVVDITNYVMLLIGQPLHAFDATKIAGDKLIVRASKPNETLTTLDGKERSLPGGSIVIADTDKTLALGGIMGGQNCAISEETDTIILESAVFDPIAIRRTAMSLGLNTDAAHRFQRHVNPDNSVLALQLATDLLKKYASGFVASRLIDHYPVKVKESKVTLAKDRLDQYLGYQMTTTQAATTLEHLGYTLSHKTDSELTVTVPSWREHDVAIPEDLIEDIASLTGYDKIPDQLPSGAVTPFASDKSRQIVSQTKNHLVSLGLREVYTYSMTHQDLIGDDRALRIANATSKEWEYMRTELFPSLAQTLQQNISWGIENDLFELSRVYIPRQNDLPEEKLRLAFSAPDLDTVKSYLQVVLAKLNISSPTYKPRPGTETHVIASVAGAEIGQMGLLNKDYREKTGLKYDRILAEIDFDKVIELANPKREFKLPPKFPEVREDITLEVGERVTVLDIINQAQKSHSLIQNVEYVGTYQGNSKKSVTVSLSFRSDEKTLTSEEVKTAREEIIEKLEKTLKASVL